MEKAKIYLKNFIGTSYEIGTQIGEWILSAPDLLQRALLTPNSYPHDKFVQIANLMVIENSVTRNNNILKLFETNKQVSKNNIKELLSTPYPKGLCCHYYKEFFGTLRSMVFNVTDKTIEMTFGSPQVNAWQTFSVGKLEEQQIQVLLPQEKANSDFYKIL